MIISNRICGSHPRRFIIFFQNGGNDVCAREGGANTYRFCASPFLKEFCMARLHLYLHLNPANFLFQKEARPLVSAVHSKFNSPPAKKSEWENGKTRRRTRGTPRVGGIQRVATRSGRTMRYRATTHAERAKSGLLFKICSSKH